MKLSYMLYLFVCCPDNLYECVKLLFLVPLRSNSPGNISTGCCTSIILQEHGLLGHRDVYPRHMRHGMKKQAVNWRILVFA